ncbi:hypothetical protein Bca52824_047965 [Brassica carinata]|uniref:Uncharacterized protein n=1 Tax=Brassica carinata TaxID=52824 RepID=A0A8X7USQ1_BRACI|nr:hypothetical protein Bca52824_047965 [Brassica carinata]
MEDLQDVVTIQYLSCADPTEAAARRQRLMRGDARGEMEEAVASIMAAENAENNLVAASLMAHSNIQSSIQHQAPLLLLNHPHLERELEGEIPVSQVNRKRGRPTKLKSTIVSPKTNT